MPISGTYVYCLIVGGSRPTVSRRRFAQLPGMGPVRLLDVGSHLWLVVADAPLGRYGEQAINRQLSDLDWVSRAAVVHEAIVESFIDQRAVLPMKLFTIFASDDRALGQVRGDRRRVDALVRRVARQDEWGVRVTLERTGLRLGWQLASDGQARRSVKGAIASSAIASRGASTRASSRAASAGMSYLSEKKAERDAAVELAEHARQTVAGLFDRLAARSRQARRRSASEMPMQGSPLLLDAAFLVPRTRAAGFRALAAREARALGRLGYHVVLTGPWPPYTFVKD
jgi:hypothetical protein